MNLTLLISFIVQTQTTLAKYGIQHLSSWACGLAIILGPDHASKLHLLGYRFQLKY
jgi:hypothetical protein